MTTHPDHEQPDHVALAELHLARAERYLKLARDHDRTLRFDSTYVPMDGDDDHRGDE